jgi:hypothetical protein
LSADRLSRREVVERLVFEGRRELRRRRKEGVMSNAFVWFHNGSHSPADSVAFYEKLLGWKAADGPPGMVMLGSGAAPFAAVMPRKGEVAGWVPYVQVENVAAATSRPQRWVRRCSRIRPRVPRVATRSCAIPAALS